jgi:hypothetical protein
MLKLTRREALLSSSAALVALPWEARADQGAAVKPYADTTAADTWMAQWDPQARDIKGALILRRFADPMYVVASPIEWGPTPDRKKDFPVVRVPVGFVTDFASIPQVFWQLLRPDGLYGYAAIVHDWLYWQQTLRRDKSDEILKLAMQEFEVDALTIGTIYGAVRLGGGFSWRGNAKLKMSGEKRLLKELPDDPKVRWSDWKKKPGVFV